MSGWSARLIPPWRWPRRHHHERAGDHGERFARGEPRIADQIAPGAVELTRDYVRLDRHYLRSLKLTGYPRSVSHGWLAPLLRLGGAVEVSLHLTPQHSGQVVRLLGHKLVQLQSSRLRDDRAGRLENPEREVAVEDAERLRDALQRGHERVFAVGAYLLLRAPTLASLDDLTRRAESLLAGMPAQTRVALYEQDTGLRTCLPHGQDFLLAHRNLDTTSAATMLPIPPALPATDGGVLYGVGHDDHSPLMLDPFHPALENANHVVFAKSGAGKSFFVKLLALRQLIDGAHVVVVDPEDEYRRVCDAVGGARVRLSGATGHRLNPLELPTPAGDVQSKPNDGVDALAEHIASLVGLCGLMVAGAGERLSGHDRAALDRALYRTYSTAGITGDPATHHRPVPLMRDLLGTLRDANDPVAADLAAQLGRYVEGSLAGLFAGPTNVALDRPLTVFDVQGLEQELRPVGLQLVAGHVWSQARREPRKRLLVVDEAWTLLQHADGGAFLAGMARRARKYQLGVVALTQDVADFLGSDHGRTVLANAAVKLALKQDDSSIGVVDPALDLSPDERRFLLSAAKGEGLLLARGARAMIRIEASDLERRLASTTPADGAVQPPSAPGATAPEHTAPLSAARRAQQRSGN